MKISCPACAAKYSIADEKVSDRLAKIRCRKCGATIVIDGKVSPPNVYTAAGDAPDADSAHEHHEVASGGASYSVDFGEGDQRTLSVGEIVAAYNAGQVTAETYLWADGFADWKPLGDVQEVVDALHTASSAPAAASPSPWDKPAAAMPKPARAAARAGRAGGGDLFGRIETAGSEEEIVTTSAADAAPGGGGGSTGARNESSVLFSLSALTSAASRPSSRPGPSPVAASSSSSTTATREDSGLIDLKALTAQATKSEAAAPPPIVPMHSPLGRVAPPPLAMGSPLGLGGGITSAADVTYPQKSKTGLYIGVGIAVAAVIIAVAFILRPEPPPAPPPAVAVQPPPPPTAAPTSTPEPLTAKPPSTGAEDDAGAAPKVASKGGIRRPGGGGKKPSGGGATAPAAGGGDAPKPAAAKRPCGCAPADLQCNMRCSAGG